jgi:CTP synthase
MFAGLIAAACGRLETVPHDNGHLRKPLTSAMSNGHSMKIHQNGGAIKSSNGSVNGVYSNGNGVHLEESC